MMGELQYDSLDKIVRAFSSPEIRVISFDIFDTLLLRPVRSEEQKFALLDGIFYEETHAHISFARVRSMAEASLRRRILRGEYQKEDIEIDEIYAQMEKEFGISVDICRRMQREEEALESRLCRPRNSGLFLYRKAVESGRRVIVASDMYLRKDFIERLLENAGITGAEIFVSSETGKRKITGSLYRHIAERLGVRPEEILHIGDNRESDVEAAAAAGLKSIWLPGTMDVFERFGCAHQAEKICSDLTDWEKAQREPGISAFRQMAANRYFDDPFRSFDPESDFNADPWFVGYAALGPEVLSLVRWIVLNADRDGVNRILFLSRDGFLPMEVYKLLREKEPSLPDFGYLYCSRIAMLPFMVSQPLDLYDLPLDPALHTPRRLIGLLSFCCDEEACLERFSEGADEPFSAESFRAFIAAFIRDGYDAARHRASRERTADFLLHNEAAPVEPGCALFDMGYSGRISQAVLEACGFPAPVYFFHGDGARQFLCEAQGGFSIRAFLDFSPYMEATMREYAYLETAPSCVGYSDERVPLFDEGPAAFYAGSAEEMQRGALAFVKDFLDFFEGYEKGVDWRLHNGAMPFEAFLRFCSEADKGIYRRVEIDDELWGGRRNIDLVYLMEARLRKLPPYAK